MSVAILIKRATSPQFGQESTSVEVGQVVNDAGNINNAAIDAAAAIAGTKIAPNFGAQNILTSGSIVTSASTIEGTSQVQGVAKSLIQAINFDGDPVAIVGITSADGGRLTLNNAALTTTINLDGGTGDAVIDNNLTVGGDISVTGDISGQGNVNAGAALLAQSATIGNAGLSGIADIVGKTSGTLRLTAADATAQTVILTTAAQTTGTTILTIPNMAGASDTLAFVGKAQTLTNKTLTSPTMTAPVLGTPASGALTNCTSIPAGQLTGTVATARMAPGTIVQKKFMAVTPGSNIHTTSSTMTATGLSITITPVFATSVFVIKFCTNIRVPTTAGAGMEYATFRDSTQLDSAGGYTQGVIFSNGNQLIDLPISPFIFDVAPGAGPYTYTIQFKSTNNVTDVLFLDVSNSSYKAYMTVEEIAQ